MRSGNDDAVRQAIVDNMGIKPFGHDFTQQMDSRARRSLHVDDWRLSAGSAASVYAANSRRTSFALLGINLAFYAGYRIGNHAQDGEENRKPNKKATQRAAFLG